MLAFIHPLSGSGGAGIDNTLPTPPAHVGGGPIIPPPLPGVWPPPGMPNLPVDPGWGNRPPGVVDPGWGQGRPLPPHVGGGPIVIPEPPPGLNPPIELPPVGIYPPPVTGLPPGKVAILVIVVGSGTCHWVVADTANLPQPK